MGFVFGGLLGVALFIAASCLLGTSDEEMSGWWFGSALLVPVAFGVLGAVWIGRPTKDHLGKLAARADPASSSEPDGRLPKRH